MVEPHHASIETSVPSASVICWWQLVHTGEVVNKSIAAAGKSAPSGGCPGGSPSVPLLRPIGSASVASNRKTAIASAKKCWCFITTPSPHARNKPFPDCTEWQGDCARLHKRSSAGSGTRQHALYHARQQRVRPREPVPRHDAHAVCRGRFGKRAVPLRRRREPRHRPLRPAVIAERLRDDQFLDVAQGPGRGCVHRSEPPRIAAAHISRRKREVDRRLPDRI